MTFLNIAGPSVGRTFLTTLWVGAYFNIVCLDAVFQHILHCTFNFNLVTVDLRFSVTGQFRNGSIPTGIHAKHGRENHLNSTVIGALLGISDL